jgi:hypothetical protein
VIRTLVDANNVATAAEDSWPLSSVSQLMFGIITNTPDPSTWGNGNLAGGPCNGVYITNADITANGGTTQLKFPPDSNTFTANVHNNTVDGQGVAQTAPKVQATFFIADFGFPQQWRQIPTGNNPPPAQDIAPNGTQAFTTNPWTVSATDLPTYQANPHQCVMVMLDALPASPQSALIVNNAAVQNMDFPTIMPRRMFRGFVAEIPTAKLELPHGRDRHIVDLLVRTREVGLRTDHPEDFLRSSIGRGGLLWTVDGYVHTGKFITLAGKKYEVVSSLGAFGYGLKYASNTPPKWRYQLFGERGFKLMPGRYNTYQMQIPRGKSGYVNVTFEGDANTPTGGPVEKPDGGRPPR